MNVCVYVWSVWLCVWVCEQKDNLLLRLIQDRSTRGHLRVFLRRVGACVYVPCSKSCYLNLIILLEIKQLYLRVFFCFSFYFSVIVPASASPKPPNLLCCMSICCKALCGIVLSICVLCFMSTCRILSLFFFFFTKKVYKFNTNMKMH